MPRTSLSAALPPAAGRIDEARFSLVYGLGAAILVHFLVLLLVALFPEAFTSPGLLLAAPPETPPPIHFTFIDVSRDHEVEKNPEADLLSDRARLEAGPPPEVTTPESRLPPSQGNTRQKVAARPEAPSPPLPRETETQLPRTAPPSAARPQASQQAGGEPQTAGAGEPEADKGSAAAATERAAGEQQGESGPVSPARPVDRRQQRFSRALDELASTPLPTDLQALAPPSTAPKVNGQGSSTQWNFDNPDPAFPVKIGNLSFDSKGADFGPWLREFHARVLSEWNRNLKAWHDDVWRETVGSPPSSVPRQVTDAEKWNRYAMIVSLTRGVTGVVFEVTRQGSIVAQDLVHPSGAQELDRSVHRTLRNVILPPLPDDYPDETLSITAGFYYNVDPPE